MNLKNHRYLKHYYTNLRDKILVEMSPVRKDIILSVRGMCTFRVNNNLHLRLFNGIGVTKIAFVSQDIYNSLEKK